MQEKNRESSKRSQKSRSDGRRVSKKNSIKSKSREYNPVEKRNQRIEKNKKISSRRNNSSKEHLSPKTKKYDNRQKTKIKKEVGSNISNKLAPKTTLKKSGDGNPVSRKSLNLFFYKNFRHPNYGYFGVGLIFACLILLFSSFDVVISKGLFFIYLGVLLLKQPRIYSQGIFIDFVTIGIVFFGLVTYLADLANYFLDMNINASGQNGADALLFIITSFKNLEVITILTTSILFYYHIQSWKLNKSGEGFLFLILAVIPILVGFVQYFKINSGLNYLVREDNLFSSIIEYENSLYTLITVCGLGSIALFLDTLKSNKVVPVVGFSGVIISLFFLIQSNNVFYYALFFYLSFIYIISLYFSDNYVCQKSLLFISPILYFAFFFYLNPTFYVQFIDAFIGSIFILYEALHVLLNLFNDVTKSGTIIGLVPVIIEHLFPIKNYEHGLLYESKERFSQIADFSVNGLFVLILLLYYFILYFAKEFNYQKARYYFFYSLVVTVLLTLFITSSEKLSFGLLLLLLIFLQLSLRIQNENAVILPQNFCKLVGILCLFLGILWTSFSIFNLPLLSDISYRIKKSNLSNLVVDYEGLSYNNTYSRRTYIFSSNKRKYFLDFHKLLESRADKNEILKLLDKAVLFDDNNIKVYLQIGYLLADEHQELAIKAWNIYFKDSPTTKMEDFSKLIYYAKDNHELLLSLNKLCKINEEFTVRWLLLLNDEDFQKYISIKETSQFNISDSIIEYQYLKRLLEEGFFEEYRLYSKKFTNSFILDAIYEKEMGKFVEALSILRQNFTPEKIESSGSSGNKKLIPRVFLENYPDVDLGINLIKAEISEKNYKKALIYVDHVLTMDNPSPSFFYWRAELFYLMGEYIDSWFAFIKYFELYKLAYHHSGIR